MIFFKNYECSISADILIVGGGMKAKSCDEKVLR